MSTKEKHWYQDGTIVLVIVIVLVLLTIRVNRFWQQEQEQQKPAAMALSGGYLEQTPAGEPVLHLQFWHVYPGTLKNGRLTVYVDYPGIEHGEQMRIHAFELWEPNEDHAVVWKFPLPGYELDQQVPIHVRLEAENARSSTHTQVWQGTAWAEDEPLTSE